MPSLLTPRRRRDAEVLDDPTVDAGVRAQSLADVGVANRLFGGTRAVLAELSIALGEERLTEATLLDVGTGLGDIPRRAMTMARRRGVTLRAVGVDLAESLARAASGSDLPVLCADALALPFAAGSVDYVICSQLLHHFDDASALVLLRELHRVARRRVIVSELRRSWAAAAGIWLASFPLRFHPVSRHDGVVSVFRGFRREELRALVHRAVARDAAVCDRLGFRTTAVWPAGAA